MRPAISGGYSVSVGGRFHQTTQVTHQVLWLKLSINPTVIDLRRQHFFCPPKKREFRLRCFGSQYPSSHNHQSSKMGRSNISFLPFRVIFHFHDYGRKGKSPSFFWWDVVHALWQCLKIHWTERHGFLKVNICNICKLSAIFRILPTEICSVFFRPRKNYGTSFTSNAAECPKVRRRSRSTMGLPRECVAFQQRLGWKVVP